MDHIYLALPSAMDEDGTLARSVQNEIIRRTKSSEGTPAPVPVTLLPENTFRLDQFNWKDIISPSQTDLIAKAGSRLAFGGQFTFERHMEPYAVQFADGIFSVMRSIDWAVDFWGADGVSKGSLTSTKIETVIVSNHIHFLR